MPIEAVMLGAGARGLRTFGAFAEAFPAELKFVAVAEPQTSRREEFAARHNIPPQRQYKSWGELTAAGKLADVAFNATLDQTHLESTLVLLGQGYEVLLEKPMANTLAGCVQLVQAAEAQGRKLQICHELRYSPFFSALDTVVKSGKLGRIITVDHRENVRFTHMAHSFVRGNWRNAEETSPMILAKCCHDMDLLFWILNQPVRDLSSFGSLTHFRAENAPTGAPKYCLDGCPVEDECLWYSPRYYMQVIDGLPIGGSIIGGRTLDERLELLKTDRYGRCVYHCDNDVVDHQVAVLEFLDGTTVTFTMQGHSDDESRTMRWDGTDATLYGKFAYGEDDWIRVHHKRSGEVEHISVEDVADAGGHGGGDFKLIAGFLHAVSGDSGAMLTSARDSLESHLMAFAAEEARVQRHLVNMDEFRARAEKLTV